MNAIYPCSTCIEQSRCAGEKNDKKSNCKSLIEYKAQRKENIAKNKEKWKNG